MTVISPALPAGATGGVQQPAVGPGVLTLGQNEANAATRLQLPEAVTASPAVVALPQQQVPAPKAVLRASVGGSASGLAAQLLGQQGELDDATLAVFTPAAAPSADAPQQHAQALVDALRQARSEADASTPPVATTAQATTAVPVVPPGSVAASLRLTTLLPLPPEPPLVPESALAPPLLRKPALATARGEAAYRVATARNATTLRRVEPVDVELPAAPPT